MSFFGPPRRHLMRVQPLPPRIVEVMRKRLPVTTTQQARQLRKHQTPAEAYAWRLLRGRRVLGFKFRRQEAIAGFFVDFYCPLLRLVIEVDGSEHESSEGEARDAQRDAVLSRCGLRVVHLENRDVTPEKLRLIVETRAAELGFPLSRMGEGVRG